LSHDRPQPHTEGGWHSAGAHSHPEATQLKREASCRPATARQQWRRRLGSVAIGAAVFFGAAVGAAHATTYWGATDLYMNSPSGDFCAYRQPHWSKPTTDYDYTVRAALYWRDYSTTVGCQTWNAKKNFPNGVGVGRVWSYRTSDGATCLTGGDTTAPSNTSDFYFGVPVRGAATCNLARYVTIVAETIDIFGSRSGSFMPIDIWAPL
jgi:hypothetical protein